MGKDCNCTVCKYVNKKITPEQAIESLICESESCEYENMKLSSTLTATKTALDELSQRYEQGLSFLDEAEHHVKSKNLSWEREQIKIFISDLRRLKKTLEGGV